MASPGGVEVGRVSVRVLPDTSRLFAELEADLKKIEARTELTINATIDSAGLDAEARRAVSEAEFAAGNIHIDAEIDTSQIHEAELALSDATSSAQGFSGGLSGIASAAIILGPALIPIIAAVAALAAGLAAPIAIAGGGLTIFGILAGFTLSETNKQLKVIDQLDTKLSGLTKGTQEYADTAMQLHNAQAALTPAQVAFAAALDKVKRSFDSIPKAIVLKPITDGLALLAHLLPLVEPILRVVSDVISDVIGQFDKAARSQGFKTFVDAFAKQLGPDLRAFATIAGNVFQGLFGLFGAFNSQLSGSVLSSLETLTDKFATWGQTVGQSKGFKSFVDYIKRVGPQVAAALGAIILAAVDIAEAFAPIGSVVLGAITALAGAIHKIPTDVLAALAGALVGLTVVSKLVGPLSALFELITLVANPVGLVVAGLVLMATAFAVVYENSKPLRNIIGDLGDFFTDKLLPPIKNAAQDVLPAFHGALKDINQTLRDNKPFLEDLGKVILVIATGVVIAGIEAFAGAIRGIGKAFKFGVGFAHTFADVMLKELRFLVTAFTIFSKAVLDSFGVIVDGAAAAFGWIPGIGDKVKAAQANFHAFADHVIGDLQKTSDRLKALQDQIDGLHGKTLTIKVIQQEQAIDLTHGPGGGIRRPGDTPPTSGHGGGGGNTYNIQAHDYNDFLRQQQARERARSGGGVLLAGR